MILWQVEEGGKVECRRLWKGWEGGIDLVVQLRVRKKETAMVTSVVRLMATEKGMETEMVVVAEVEKMEFAALQ
jgi:hypothetical protein